MHWNLYFALLLAAILYGGLFFLRSGARGGRLGRFVRESDWWAWKQAVEDKERELIELRAAEPERHRTSSRSES